MKQKIKRVLGVAASDSWVMKKKKENKIGFRGSKRRLNVPHFKLHFKATI